MANERGGYAHLLDLCQAWAVEANGTKELILRRVIEWAVEGTFPSESFLTNTGNAVPPIKMLAAFRALHNPGHVFTWPETASYIAPTTVGSLNLRIHPDEALDVLDDVVVSVDGVQRFRDRMGIRPGDLPPACPQFADLEAADFHAPESVSVDEQEEAAPSNIRAERQCEEWLKKLMAGGQKPVKAKPAYREEAMGLFTGLSWRGFDRAWANAIISTGNEEWSKHGRKS